jgi:hypothetical protein
MACGGPFGLILYFGSALVSRVYGFNEFEVTSVILAIGAVLGCFVFGHLRIVRAIIRREIAAREQVCQAVPTPSDHSPIAAPHT